jgi:hypothetical protein
MTRCKKRKLFWINFFYITQYINISWRTCFCRQNFCLHPFISRQQFPNSGIQFLVQSYKLLMQIQFEVSSALLSAILCRFLRFTMRGIFLYLHCPYIDMLLIYVQFSNLHLMYVLMSVRTCMKNPTHCLHRDEQSPIAAPATTWFKQNVNPCWEEVLHVNTISHMWKKYIDITFKSHRCAVLQSDWNLQVKSKTKR